MWERGERRATRSGGGEGRRLPKLPEGNLSLSADFWLARGIDDATVQKSADVSEVECPYSKLLLNVVGFMQCKARFR